MYVLQANHGGVKGKLPTLPPEATPTDGERAENSDSDVEIDDCQREPEEELNKSDDEDGVSYRLHFFCSRTYKLPRKTFLFSRYYCFLATIISNLIFCTSHNLFFSHFAARDRDELEHGKIPP